MRLLAKLAINLPERYYLGVDIGFFGSLKSEWLYFQRFETRQQAITSIFYYIESFYNRKRRHSAIEYLSPLAFEQASIQQNDLSYFRVH